MIELPNFPFKMPPISESQVFESLEVGEEAQNSSLQLKPDFCVLFFKIKTIYIHFAFYTIMCPCFFWYDH